MRLFQRIAACVAIMHPSVIQNPASASCSVDAGSEGSQKIGRAILGVTRPADVRHGPSGEEAYRAFPLLVEQST